MIKRFLSLLLIVPVLVCCNDKLPEQDPLDGEDYAEAAPRIKSGETYLANSEYTEKFITEVNYPEKTYSEYTKIFDYYGGFDGKNFNWDNWKKEWPDGDKPNSYSIRWKRDPMAGAYTLLLSDKLGWSAETSVKAGSCFVDITNLVPDDEYTYKVTSEDGTVVSEGSFKTKGHLHQVFFKSKCRNARDLGGWKTKDGKTVKYRKVYRGGRMNDPWETMLNSTGKKEVLAEGIGAELELRGSDDYMTVPAVDGLDHCHPCIEEGGKVMLGVSKPSNYNCAKWLAYDVKRADFVAQQEVLSKDDFKAFLKSYTPTQAELEAFQVAYKAKTKECFEFVANSVKAGKGVYFHCSLGRDRTGTMGVIVLGVLGVPEGDISKEYELTYFAPVGFSVSSSDKESNPQPIFKNDRMHWVYSDVVPYFWDLSTDGTFASGVEKYLRDVAGVSQATIDEFRKNMLQ